MPAVSWFPLDSAEIQASGDVGVFWNRARFPPGFPQNEIPAADGGWVPVW